MDTVFILKFTQGHNSINNVGGVTVLNVFCTSSDHILYFLQSFKKISHRVSELLSGHNLWWTDGQTDRQPW